ncbi:MAG: XTP/dITP diphosphatase [Candidatus Omnitrophica bacterium]|nr:XTP/dITP diphosphatase [Candidatus Omnitrophota bacterium]
MSDIVIATRNAGKVKEINAILRGMNATVYSLRDFGDTPEIVEDGKTFEENASKKARIISQCTNKLTIADDSGLEVDFLGGRPGVRSSRFAGEDGDYLKNNKLLLRLMDGVPNYKRGARFVCVISIAQKGKILEVVRGTCTGRIALKMRGKTGFGYDPLFIDPKTNKTFAELGPRAKNRISHRYRALKKARKALKRFLDN